MKNQNEDLRVNSDAGNAPCFLNVFLQFRVRANFPFIIIQVETFASCLTCQTSKKKNGPIFKKSHEKKEQKC